MFVDHDLWPPPPSDPPPPKRPMTEAQEKLLGWAFVGFAAIMVAGPLAGSSVIVAVVAAVRSLMR